MIHLKRISKVFDSDLLQKAFTALDEVTFQLPKGEITGFLGANGAGKTTTIKIIMDFIRPTRGIIEFDPEMGKNRNEILRNIGFLPERPYFYPHLTGNEFLFYMGSLNKMKKSEILAQTERWAPRLKIDFALDRKINKYSKGMLQRLGFVATVLHNPKFIILDEPLSGLDPIGRKEMKEAMVEVMKDGKTVFFSSHIISDVEEICTHVVFLESGKLKYQGSLNKLLSENVRTDFKLNYLDAAGVLNSEVVLGVDKDKRVRELLEAGLDIQHLQPVRPTLEEIIYKTGGKSD